jgi:hypothetical protein
MEAVSPQLKNIVYPALRKDGQVWLDSRLEKILNPASARELFLTYSLIGRKLPTSKVSIPEVKGDPLTDYLRQDQPDLTSLARIYLLSKVLEADRDYFIPKVGQLIQVADTSELITFLRYLYFLPEGASFVNTGVEALRTNIADVFDAIALDNPYPAAYFNEQQWNQMYLKAAFMQRDLLRIREVSRRGNAALARIISDYAHERWAASREVDPLIWQPVGPFLDQNLIGDMERLLASENPREQMAGFLCCRVSQFPGASEAISGHSLAQTYESSPFDWKELKP